MNFRRLIAAVIILSLLLTQSVFANDKLLVGKEYFTTLHKALEEAKDSIYVAMYIISLPSGEDRNNPVSVLVEDLIKAKKRGIYVKVVLDDTKFNVNYRAFRELKEALNVRINSIVNDRDYSIVAAFLSFCFFFFLC
jgi:phosphatidylserine/phosphatidylglycerophosphate/cardiolipin synthase-like enzyme